MQNLSNSLTDLLNYKDTQKLALKYFEENPQLQEIFNEDNFEEDYLEEWVMPFKLKQYLTVVFDLDQQKY